MPQLPPAPPHGRPDPRRRQDQNPSRTGITPPPRWPKHPLRPRTRKADLVHFSSGAPELVTLWPPLWDPPPPAMHCTPLWPRLPSTVLMPRPLGFPRRAEIPPALPRLPLSPRMRPRIPRLPMATRRSRVFSRALHPPPRSLQNPRPSAAHSSRLIRPPSAALIRIRPLPPPLRHP